MTHSKVDMTKSELRKFGLVTAAMLVLFFDLLIPWIWNISRPIWPVVVGAILVFVSLVAPAALLPVYRVWMRLAEALGWINTRIILGLIFFLMFVPFGAVLRLFRDPMHRKVDQSTETYRVLSKPPNSQNMERPF